MATYSTRGSVAVIEVDNPPVNALSYNVRIGIRDGIQRAAEDKNIIAIVLCSKGKLFIAGADMKEFQNGKGAIEPTLHSLVEILELSEKPIVVVINGTAFGGGLEIALSCHYRIATPSARIGFPEVKIGILPGACGTQRLPRLVGLEAALDITVSGHPVSAKEALQLGVFDKLVEGDVFEEAVRYAKSISKYPVEGRRLSKMAVKGAEMAQVLGEAALRKANKKSPGMLAPVFNIKAVLAAAELPFEQGVIRERELFTTLFMSGQSKALQYYFFALRAAPKWELPGKGNFKTASPKPIKSAGVVGAGTMGTGIVMAILNAGIPVNLLEVSEERLQQGVKVLKGLYAGSVQRGKMSVEKAKKLFSRLTPTVSYGDLAQCDIVIEAVFERMDLKKKIFGELDRVCKPDAILASNTSTLDIDQMALATRRPGQVVGTHFFVPAYYMQLLENVRGKYTSAETAATAMRFGTRIGKTPVLVGNCHGFVGNRMYGAYTSQAIFLVEEGALPEEVDQVIEDFGIPGGPFKIMDLSGLDIGYSIRQELAKEDGGPPLELTTRTLRGQRYCSLPDHLVIKGRLGRKTGQGWYRYASPGSREAYPDEAIASLVNEHCKLLGITRRKISKQEILERCLYSLMNEGFKTLEDRIVTKPSDIDVTLCLGYGWPTRTGGPLYYATQVGLKRLVERLTYYHEQYPDIPTFRPSKLLVELSQSDAPIETWGAISSSKL